MSTSTGAIPCRLATRAAKEPAIRDGPSLGRKRRESRDDPSLGHHDPAGCGYSHTAPRHLRATDPTQKGKPRCLGESGASGRDMPQ